MIGMFDSGLGGLSVLTHVRTHLPDAAVRYVADSGRAPYGSRPITEVRRFAEEITDHLLASGASMIVLACNAASAAALYHLRSRHPGVPFVGMEPAVKPAALLTRTGVVGVLTTNVTFEGELYASVVDRFAGDVQIRTELCEGWVELVESGRIEGDTVRKAVAGPVHRLLEAGADTLVLGCTHYPFLSSTIRSVAGDDVAIIDPGPAVARQVARIAIELEISSGGVTIDTTADCSAIAPVARVLAGYEMPCKPVVFPSQ